MKNRVHTLVPHSEDVFIAEEANEDHESTIHVRTAVESLSADRKKYRKYKSGPHAQKYSDKNLCTTLGGKKKSRTNSEQGLIAKKARKITSRRLRKIRRSRVL